MCTVDGSKVMSPPPRKPGWPIIGNIELAGEKAKFVSSCDGLTSLSLFGLNIVLVQDPEHCTRIYRLEGSHVVAGNFLPSMPGVSGPTSLFNLTGKEHKHLRTSLLSCFHRSTLLKTTARLQEVVGARLRRWAKMETFDAIPEIEDLTFELGMEFVGIDTVTLSPEERKRLKRDVQLVNDALISLPVNLGEYSAYGRGINARERILAIMKTSLDQRRVDIAAARTSSSSRCAAAVKGDMLRHLLGVRDVNGDPLSEEILLDNMMAFVLGSFGTMRSTLSAFLLSMCRFPAIQETAHKHIREVLREDGVDDDDGAPLPADIWQKLEYIEQMFMESQRYVPSVVLAGGRSVVKDFELGGHVIKKGTTIIADVLTRSRSERYWANPNDFDPTRFDKSRPDYRRNVSKLGNFGGGARKCIGRSYAALEVKVIATLLLRDFTMKFAPQSVSPKPTYPVTLCLDRPFLVELVPRRKDGQM